MKSESENESDRKECHVFPQTCNQNASFCFVFFFLPFESAARRRVFHTIAQRTCHAWIVCLADGSDHLSHRLLAKTINGNSLSLHCK